MKYKVLIAMLTLTAVITGCQSKNITTDTVQQSEPVTEDMQEIEDLLPTEYKATEEIKNAELSDFKIQIKDKVYTMPFDVKTLIEDGYTFDEDPDHYLEWTAINDYNDVRNTHTVRIQNDDNTNIPIGVYDINQAKSEVLLRDLQVRKLGNLPIYNNDEPIELGCNYEGCFLPKGITKGATEEEIIEAYGEPFMTSIVPGGSAKNLYYTNHTEFFDEEGHSIITPETDLTGFYYLTLTVSPSLGLKYMSYRGETHTIW